MVIEPLRNEVVRALLVWAALLALLATTMAVTLVPARSLHAPLNFGIAGIKVALVAVFYMHLRRAGPTVRLVALGGLLWLAILIVLSLADYWHRAISPAA
ncbi:MAG TPA: cytochrome C oxidase subunit IV family protein [Steroidobacteraceae bacterium]|nr:cytochrome C oxidase subunit IV family protein [Steroidobacteraceae bacterium]